MEGVAENTPEARHKYVIRVGTPLALMLLTLYFCWLNPGHAANLVYENDEIDYAVSAATWFHTGSYRVPVGGEYAPPQYPFGFPLMSLPFLILHDSVGAPILCVLFCAVGLVLLTYSIGRRFAGVPVGVLAAVLLLSILLFRRMSRHVIADVPAVFLTFLLLWCLLAAFESKSKYRWAVFLFIGAAATGLAVTVRLNAVFVLLPVAAFLAMQLRSNRGKALVGAAVFVAVILAFVIPLLAFHSRHFGSPFRTGYCAWASWIHDSPGVAFNARYFLSPAMSWPPEAANGNSLAYAAGIVSFFSEIIRSPLDYIGSILTLFTVILGLLVLFRNKREGRLFLFLSGLFLIPHLVLFVFYYYQDMRFMLPFAPLLALLAAIGTTRALQTLWKIRGKRRIASFAFLFVFVLIIGRFHIRNLFYYEHFQALSSQKYAAAQTLADIAPGDAVIVSGLYPTYVEHLVIQGTGRRFYPITGNGPVFMKNYPPQPPHDIEQAGKMGARVYYPAAAASEKGIALLRAAAARGKAIYLDEYSTRRQPEALARLKKHFHFEKAAMVGGWKIHRLAPRVDKTAGGDKRQTERLFSGKRGKVVK